MTTADISHILTFWFGPPEAPSPFIRWFTPDPTLDAQIRSDFGPLILEARKTDSSLTPWAETPKGALALLLLLDQFPRNIYRGSADAFASDPKARDVAVSAIAKGFDKQVEPLHQSFFYLPLVHAEDLLAQVAAVKCYEGLVARLEDGTPGKEFAVGGEGFSWKHLEAIQAFGRFPGRNEAFGRESTREEEEWLRVHPGGF